MTCVPVTVTDVRDKITEQQRTMTTTMSAGFESSLKDILGRLAAIQIPQEILTTEVAKLVAALGNGEDVEEAVQTLQEESDASGRYRDPVWGFVVWIGSREANWSAVNELSTTIKERTNEFANMNTALEGSRTELDSQLNELAVVAIGIC